MRPNTRTIDERELRVIPGAFGFDKELQVKQFMRRADKHFLDGTGHYKNQLRILIAEEYGFRDWLWTYPGTIQELVADWKAGRRPLYPGRYARHGQATTGLRCFSGEIDLVYWDRDYYMGADREEHVYRRLVLAETQSTIDCIRNENDLDGTAHVHEEDDSYLRVGYYELRGLDDVIEHIEVLDALADIV